MMLSNKFSFSKKYYLLNSIFMLERTAWFILIIQIPIFISQKGVGGLGYSQMTKGVIYLYWVLLQNSLPLITGNMIDWSNKKKSILLLSCLILFLSFLFIGLFHNIYSLLIGITLVSIGVSLFNPLMKAQIGNEISAENSSLGWGFHFWIYNFVIFIFGVPYSKYLRELGWEYVFVGAGLLYILAFFLSLFYKEEKLIANKKVKISTIIANTKTIFRRNYNYVLLISMSGFSILFMQFYETLPNFIYDWIDTSNIITSLDMSKMFQMETWAGNGISFEWLYNINTGLTLLLLIPSSLYLKKINSVNSIFIGVLLVVMGFLLSIISQNGIYLISGFVVYTIGELITNPKYTEYLSNLSLQNEKSTHMGLLFLSNLIGYPVGSLLGGYMYQHYGEKASLAQQHLYCTYGIDSEIGNAYNILIEKTGLSGVEITRLLWDKFDPLISFLPFIVIGVLSLAGILIYKSKINRNT